MLLKITSFKTIFKESNGQLFSWINNNFFSQHIKTKVSRLEEDKNVEENAVKDVRNSFKLKTKKRKKMMLQCIRNLFRPKKKIKQLKT